jgi:hypothetical protein
MIPGLTSDSSSPVSFIMIIIMLWIMCTVKC